MTEMSSRIWEPAKEQIYDAPDNKWSGSASELIEQARMAGIFRFPRTEDLSRQTMTTSLMT